MNLTKPITVDEIYGLLPYVVRANDPGAIRKLVGALTAQHNFYADKLGRLPELHDPRIAASYSLDDFPDDDADAFAGWLLHVRNRTEQSAAALALADTCSNLVSAWRQEQHVLGLLGPIVGNAITSRLLVASLRKLIEFSITRHHVKGTATSASILGRIFGFLEFRVQELWTRYRLTNPSDPRSSVNDADFANTPELYPYWPLASAYDSNLAVIRERTGLSTVTGSEPFQVPAGSPGYNPFNLGDGPSRTLTFSGLQPVPGLNHWFRINDTNPFGQFTQELPYQLATGVFTLSGGTSSVRAFARLPVGQPMAYSAVASASPTSIQLTTTGAVTATVGQAVIITHGPYTGMHTVLDVGTRQVETATVITSGSVTAGTAHIIVTGSLVPGGTVDLPIAITNGLTAAGIATLMRAALAANASIAAVFAVGGDGATIQLVTLQPAENDASLNIDIEAGTSGGVPTQDESTDTTAGSLFSITIDGVFSVTDVGQVWPNWTSFEAFEAGEHGNTVQVTVSSDPTSSRYKRVVLTGVLSRIQYKSSMFDVTMAVDNLAFSLQHPPVPVSGNSSASPIDPDITVTAEASDVSTVAQMVIHAGGGVLPTATVLTDASLLYSQMTVADTFYVVVTGATSSATAMVLSQAGTDGIVYVATLPSISLLSPVAVVRIPGCDADVLLPATSFVAAAITVIQLQRYTSTADPVAAGDLRALSSSTMMGRQLVPLTRMVELIMTRSGTDYLVEAFEHGVPVMQATLASGPTTLDLGGGDTISLMLPVDLVADGDVAVATISQIRVTADIVVAVAQDNQILMTSLAAYSRIDTFLRVSATPGLNGLRTVVSRRERTDTAYDTVTSVVSQTGTVNGHTATIVDDGTLGIVAAYWDSVDQVTSVERDGRDLYLAITGTGGALTINAYSDTSGTVVALVSPSAVGNPLLIATTGPLGNEMARLLINVPTPAYASGACLLLHVTKLESLHSTTVVDTLIDASPASSSFAFGGLPSIQPAAPGGSGWPRFTAGRLAGDMPLQGNVYGQQVMSDPSRDFAFDQVAYAELIAVMRTLFEEVRPITRQVRKEAIGFLVTDQIRYAPSIRQTSVVLQSLDTTHWKLDVVDGVCVFTETTDDLTDVPVQSDHGLFIQWGVTDAGVFLPTTVTDVEGIEDVEPVLVYIQAVDQRFTGFVGVNNLVLVTMNMANTEQISAEPWVAQLDEDGAPDLLEDGSYQILSTDKALVVERLPAPLRQFFSRWADSTDAPPAGWWQQDRPEDDVLAQVFFDDGIASHQTDHWDDRQATVEQRWAYDGQDRFVGRDIRNRTCGVAPMLIEPPPSGDSGRQDGLFYDYAVGFANHHNSYAWRDRATNQVVYSEYTYDSPDIDTGATRIDNVRSVIGTADGLLTIIDRTIDLNTADGRIEGAASGDDVGFGVTPNHQYGDYEIQPWQPEISRTRLLRSMQSSTLYGTTTLAVPPEQYAVGQLLRLPSPFASGDLTITVSTLDYVLVPTPYFSATVEPLILVADMQAWPSDATTGIEVSITADAGVVTWLIEEVTEDAVHVSNVATGSLAAPRSITQLIVPGYVGHGYIRVWASSTDGAVKVVMKRTGSPVFVDFERPASAAMWSHDRQSLELTIMDDDGDPHPFTFDGYDDDRESYQPLQTGLAAWRGGQWPTEAADTLTSRAGMLLPAIRS